MAIPIFFVHKTNSSYLKYALKQARKFNPESPIYLLGDESNNKYPFVTHLNISDYSASADEFKRVYRHLSAAPFDYELFCFLRWFYIRDFIVKNNIESFIYLDSDVLVFSNLTQALEPFKHLSIANVDVAMPAFTYFGNSKVLIDFCEYMKNQYIIPEYSHRLDLEWEAQKPRNWGGVCDMLIFLYYFRDFPENLGKLDVIKNNSTFDVYIREGKGYEIEGDNKKIKWKNKQPYCFHIETKQWIRFHGFHYQGHSKALMYKHYSGGGYYLHRLSEYLKDMRDKFQLRTRLRKFIKSGSWIFS